jgi:hypothetical protein
MLFYLAAAVLTAWAAGAAIVVLAMHHATALPTPAPTCHCPVCEVNRAPLMYCE